MAFTTKKASELIKRHRLLKKYTEYLNTHPATNALHRAREQGRNEPCACGSGLKYKKCCLHPLKLDFKELLDD